MKSVLEVRRLGGLAKRMPLREGAAMSLGAAEEADLRFIDEARLSAVQAELRLKSGALKLRKLTQATNPVYVNGQAVVEAKLLPGECFVVGETKFTFMQEADDLALGTLSGGQDLSQRLRLLDLLEIPEILRLRSAQEALTHVAGTMRLLVGALWVEIRGADGQVLAGDAVKDRSPAPSPALDLMERARLSSPLPVWSQAAGTNGSTPWAIACAMPVSGQGEICFHVFGRGGGDQSLQDRARLVGLVADMAARNLGLRRMEDFKQRLERFFSGQVVAKILDSADASELEPRLTRATVMFFDIRGFSRLAEQTSAAALASVRELRRVMTAMTEEIFSENGVVIQFMGDGILACWNLPYEDSHAEDHACRAALKMVRRLRETAPQWKCGIGIHAGELVAGSLGSEQVFCYTVMGMVVNQASRVEGITKVVEAPILATGEVVSRLSPESCRRRRLGIFQPAGMSLGLELHQIMPLEAEASGAGSIQEALSAFEAGQWETAYNLLDRQPASDLPARYLKALAEMHRRKPPKDWRGVIELDAK
jgi:adenylate cyclase